VWHPKSQNIQQEKRKFQVHLLCSAGTKRRKCRKKDANNKKMPKMVGEGVVVGDAEPNKQDSRTK